MSYKNIQAQRITGLAAEIATVGGVTGSGTLNYIPKWTPSGIVVGNSQIFDNGTNVGIGTVLPTAKFNVEGGNDVTSLFQSNASSVTGYAGRFFANSVNTQSNVGIYVTASNGFQNYAIHADEGNSGFGGLDANSKIYVKGIDSTLANYALKVDNSASSPLLYVRNDGRVTVGKTFEISRYGFNTTRAFWVEAEVTTENTLMSTSNADLVFKTRSSGTVETMRMTAAGKVIINDGSYLTLGVLDPSTDKYAYIDSAGNATASAGLKFSVCQVGNTTGVTAMQIEAGGNIGIGTTSPTARTHIQGVDATSSNYALKVDNSASSPLLYVRNDGNIGIGIIPTLSDVKLEIKVATNQRFIFKNFTYPTIGAALTLQNINDATTDVTNVVTLGLDWYHASRNNLFSNTANIIVPTAKVHIIGNNAASDLFALKVDNSASSPLLYVRNDGNVGVGTSTPNTKVDIDGDFAHRSNGSAATISADTNDLSTSGRSFIRLNNTSGSSKNITGFANGYDGKRLVICNVSATDDIVIIHQDTNSSASNRIITGNLGANNTIKPDDTIEMIYDASTQRWRIINHSAG